MSAAAVENIRPIVGRMPLVALIALNRAAPGLTDREIKAAMLELGYEPAALGRLPFYVRSDSALRVIGTSVEARPTTHRLSLVHPAMRFARLTFVAASISVMAMAGVLFGCAVDMHRGPEVTNAQVSAFTLGTSTVEQVIAVLGKPSFSGVRPNGEKFAGYGRLHTRIKPPSVGTVTGIEPRSEFVGMETTVFFFDTASKRLRVERSPEKAPASEAK